MVCFAVAGCTSAGGKGGSSSASESGTVSVIPSPFASPPPVGAVLQDIALKATDLATGFAVNLVPGGSTVKGQVTLDGCGFSFTTEAHRIARRSYSVRSSTGQDTGVTNEVVAYDSADQALLALDQWAQAATICAKATVKSAVKGVPDITFKVLRYNLNTGVPVTPNVLTVESESSEGLTIYTVGVLQVRGRYLDIVLARGGQQPTDTQLSSVTALASVTGKRLATVS
jgi:hypothetical protein